MSKKEKKEEPVEAEVVDENLPEAVEPGGDVAVQEDQAAFLDESAESEESVGGGIPYMDLKQKKEHAGLFFCDQEQIPREEIQMIILKEARSRCLWPPGKFSSESKPICRSVDGVSPDKNLTHEEGGPVLKTMSDSCALIPGNKDRKRKCAYANWNSKEPPECQESFDILFMDKNTFQLFWISFSATQISPLRKQLLVPLDLQKKGLTFRRRAKGEGAAHSCMFEVTMTSKLREGESGDSYIPQFHGLKELPEEVHLAMVNAAIQVKDQQKRRSFEPEQDDSPVNDDEDFANS